MKGEQECPSFLRKAVFLDRDGTLNEEVRYLHRIADFAWIPGAPSAVHRLNEARLLTIVVTNQAGVAHGYYDEEDVQRLHRFINVQLKQAHAWIDAFYYSPYHPKGVVTPYRRSSPCRKPGIGLFEQAIQAWHIDPAKSFVIGDKDSDIEPGHQLGMTTFLVETGYGKHMKAATQADYVVKDISVAVARILEICTTTP